MQVISNESIHMNVAFWTINRKKHNVVSAFKRLKYK